MEKEKIIREFVDFVEGTMDFETFWHNYQNNKDYYNLLDDKKPGMKYPKLKNQTINQNISIFSPNTSYGKAQICHDIFLFLQFYGISAEETQVYVKSFKFLMSIQPSYILVEDEYFLNKIITQAPEGLKKSEKNKWIKNRIKEMFKYDVKPPRWIQDPEWPIINGKPLVFKSQTRQRIEDERVFYTFYDPDTLEETIITQFY